MRSVSYSSSADGNRPGGLSAGVLSVLFEMETSNRPMEPTAGSHAAVYHFDRFLLCRSYIDSGHCSRSAALARWDDLDHFVVHLLLQGDMYYRTDLACIRLRAMDIVVCDLACGVRLGFRRAEAISLIFPRAELDPHQRVPSIQHGHRLHRSAPVGALLASHLIALSDAARQVGDAEATVLSGVTRDMILACLSIGLTADTDFAASARPDPAVRVRSYIEHNLQRPELGPADLARDLGLSRSQLYRQFERFGGVASYIRRRRLRRGHAEICDPRSAHRRIGEIAFSVGFEDEGHFSRLFRQAYGMSPRTARAHAPGGSDPAAPPPGGASFAQWVKALV